VNEKLSKKNAGEGNHHFGLCSPSKNLPFATEPAQVGCRTTPDCYGAGGQSFPRALTARCPGNPARCVWENFPGALPHRAERQTFGLFISRGVAGHEIPRLKDSRKISLLRIDITVFEGSLFCFPHK